MKITTPLLKTWTACADGRLWFKEHFPHGADYGAIQSELRKQKRGDWVSWLANKAYAAVIQDPSGIADLVKDEVDTAIADTKDSPNSSSGNYSTSASSGNYSKSASSGNYSKSASSGNYSTSASSGYGSKSASSGNYSTSASSGNYSKSASSGNYSKSASSGYGSTSASSGDGSTSASSGNYSTSASSGNYSTSASSGNYSTSASSGYGSKSASVGLRCFAKAGENGCFALFWNDGKRDRITVAYVGEDGVKADTLYKLNAKGELVEA